MYFNSRSVSGVIKYKISADLLLNLSAVDSYFCSWGLEKKGVKFLSGEDGRTYVIKRKFILTGNDEASSDGEALESIWLPPWFTGRTGLSNLRLIGSTRCIQRQETREAAQLPSPVLTLQCLIWRKTHFANFGCWTWTLLVTKASPVVSRWISAGHTQLPRVRGAGCS